MITGSACTRPSASPPWPDTTAGKAAPPTDGSEALSGSKAPDHRSESEVQTHLTAARLALATGNYSDAFIEIELASTVASGSEDPETLFLSGLFYADPGNPTADRAKAQETLHRIEQEYPESQWAGQSRILAQLLTQLQAAETENSRLNRNIAELEKKLTAERNSVQSLKKVLKKMKEIDLGLPSEE